MRIDKDNWFAPELILECGQVFHWMRSGNGYEGQSGGRFLAIVEEKNAWRLESDDDAYWREYFALDMDYASLYAAQDNAPLRRAMDANRGLRVLRQPPWEALLAFLLSSNNHIPRITSLVHKICTAYGQKLREGIYTFPAPHQLIGQEARLRDLGCGYRAKYLAGTAQMLESGFSLESLRDMSYEDAHRRICALPGVGPKVADCALLFGCGHTEAFPVDVWMERCLPEYGITGKDRGEMSRNARATFGKNAGIVQQFMFHYARLGEK